MYFKKLLAALTSSALLLSSLSVTSISAADGDFTYEINADGTSVTITGCTLYDATEIEIPATIGDYTVTAIAADAFDGGKLGDQFTNLTEVTVPASVTSIDFSAFSDVANISAVNIAEGNTVYSTVDNAVYSVDGSTLYYVVPTATEYTVADGTTEIAEKALAYGDEMNTITEVTIPESVTTIGKFATVYGSVVTIYGVAGSAAEIFAATNANVFVAQEDESAFVIEVNEDGTTATIVGCTDKESAEIVIPETVDGYTITGIAAGAFDGGKLGSDFENVTAITIPATVTDIDFAAFNDCYNLETLTIDAENETYKSVDDIAVYSADGATLYYVNPSVGSYEVADGTTEIAANAMAYGDEMNTITEVTIPESVTTIGRMATVYGSAVTIYGVAGSAAETFADENANNFVAEESIFVIEVNEDGTTATIVGCTDKESAEIVIPETVDGYTITGIAAGAFDGGKLGSDFENVTAITIPATVTDIDFAAFNDCYNLETLTIDAENETYKSVDDIAVYSADGATLYYVNPSVGSYEVADGTTEIAEKALAYGDEMNTITEVTIPESVTTIGRMATVYGSAVTIYGVAGSAAETFADENANIFEALEEGIFVIEVNEDGTTATIVGCTDYESTEIEIPAEYEGYTITGIAADAFDGGKLGTNFINLTAVTIPATVTDIDFAAFSDCESLETITVDSANEAYKSTDGDTAVYSADGSTLHYVIPAERAYTVADGTTEIAPYALAYGNEDTNCITDITIPESVTTIGSFAAVYGPQVVIRGYVGSAAETFAEKNNNTFIGDILYGDADDDGDVDGYDALYCLQASVYQVEPSEINILQGNVDGVDNGVLTSADALLILQYCAMSIDAFPIEG